MQIKFNTIDLEQSFSLEEWEKFCLEHFINQAKKRSIDMIERFSAI